MIYKNKQNFSFAPVLWGKSMGGFSVTTVLVGFLALKLIIRRKKKNENKHRKDGSVTDEQNLERNTRHFNHTCVGCVKVWD